MPFASYQLTAVILNNAKLRKHFSSSAVEIFSSNAFKNVTVKIYIKFLDYCAFVLMEYF